MTSPTGPLAIAGAPGRFDPAPAPVDLVDLGSWWPVPNTVWATGWYVVLADASEAHWAGADYQAGRAPGPDPDAPPGPPPTAVEIRDWLKLSTDQLSDHDLGVFRAGEIANQRSECRIPADLAAQGLLPAQLVASIYRRVARAVAARGIPLGVRSGDGEFGPLVITSYDAEINRLEGTYRRFVTG